MTTLDPMPTRAELSPLEHLQALIQDQAGPAREWRMKLPTLRAQSAATSFKLRALARTPPTTPAPERDFADVVLAAPTEEWANDVADRLRDALPEGVQVALGAPGDPPRDSSPLTAFTVNCRVSIARMPGAAVTERVRAALVKMEGLEIDYSKLLDLVVIAPSG